ncbi:MAG: hypothetical protein WCJ72_09935, partial [Chryseobacterium sp.]
LGGILLDIGKRIAVTFVVLLSGTVVRVVGRGLDGVKLFCQLHSRIMMYGESDIVFSEII